MAGRGSRYWHGLIALMARVLLLVGLVFLPVLPGVAKGLMANTLARPDGSMIHYELDIPDAPARTALLVLLQGSGCAPVAQNANLAAIRTLFAGFAALTVDKYGVDPARPLDVNDLDCPPEFHAHHTVSQRVADYAGVIAQLRGAPWWNGELVLFGGSEGGLVAAILAGEVSADAAVLLSTGGGLPFGEMVRQTIPPEGWPTVDQAFAMARENPDSAETWAGSSYRFWADIIDRRVGDDMIKADTAFLLIQGGNDPSSPVETARIVSDLFAAAGRCNLTYWELPGYDHAMADAGGVSHMSEVGADAAGWVRARLASRSEAGCLADN